LIAGAAASLQLDARSAPVKSTAQVMKSIFGPDNASMRSDATQAAQLTWLATWLLGRPDARSGARSPA